MKEGMDAITFEQSFERLNEYQKAAVIDRSKVLLVNAQVGSGKTTVLAHKILYLHFVKGIPLESMVVLTFTNKAANEIKNRIKELKPSISDEEMKFFGTFHSFARVLLSTILPIEQFGYSKGFSIADVDEILEVYERVINENSLSVKYRNKIKKRIEAYRQGKLLYGNMKHDDDMEEFYRLLTREKIKCNIMEFDDLIDYTVKLLPESDFSPEWIIVDEFQDCDSKQLEIIHHMKKGKASIFAVGDPNQVIYTWRGSRTNIFESFKKEYDATEISLPINYRSTSNILDAARVFQGTGGGLKGVREKGNPIVIKKHHNTFNEAIYLCDKIKQLREIGIPYNEIAVFYRKQKNSEVFADVFEKHGIPFEVSVKKTLKDIPVLYWLVRLLKAAVNVNDKDSIAFILKNNRYGLGMNNKQVTEALREFEAGATLFIDILNKIRGFGTWCSSFGSQPIDCRNIYEYFDLSMYLMPTSISFEEDRQNVYKLLDELTEYIAYRQIDMYYGIREYVNNSSLYGSQIMNETIHEEEDSVKLMTLHASKGLEFKCVFISGANLGSIPLPNRASEEEQEEQRLFFVGMTRAKDYLEISYHIKPEDFGVYGVPSPFLRMIPTELIESEDFGSRAASLIELRREIKSNIDRSNIENMVAVTYTSDAPKKEQQRKRVYHDKYGEGIVTAEDDNDITVLFDIYGEKTFSRMFLPIKYIE